MSPQVDGVDVVELGRPEVVQLLREAAERVEVVVSRQEVVEEQGDENEVRLSGCGQLPL